MSTGWLDRQAGSNEQLARSRTVRTPSLSLVVDEFLRQQDEVIRHWSAQFDLGEQLGTDDLRHACTMALMSSASNWELFRSNWHIRAATTDATQLKNYLEGSVLSSLSKDVANGFTSTGTRIEVHLAVHPTLAVATALLDASNKNITFRGKDDSIRKSKQHLAPKFVQKVSALTDDDWKLIDLVVSTRNAIAHGSTASVKALNDAATSMRRTSDKNLRTLARPKNNISHAGIGAYLYGQVETPGEYPNVRVILLCLQLKAIAAKLRV